MQSMVLPAQGFLLSDFSLQSGAHHQVALQSSLGKTASSLGKSWKMWMEKVMVKPKPDLEWSGHEQTQRQQLVISDW